MLLKTRGIVLRTVKYGETSVIADVYTEDQGLHTFIAGGVRQARARMPFSLFQPMTVVELVSYGKRGAGTLSRLREVRTAEVYTQIPFDIRRGAVALFLAEVCRKALREAEENPALFAFLIDFLLWLDRSPFPLANLHLYFLVQLSFYLGFQPQDDGEAGPAPYFDLKEGLFSDTPPPQGHFLQPAEAARLQDLLNSSAQTCHEVAINRAQRRLLLQGLLEFYQLHLPGFEQVHTPDILNQVLEG